MGKIFVINSILHFLPHHISAREEGSWHGTARAEVSRQESPGERAGVGGGRWGWSRGGLSGHPEDLTFPLSVSQTSQVFTRPFRLRG